MKICVRCNTELPDTAKFCTRCGMRMEVIPVQPVPAPVVETPTPVVEEPAPVVEETAPVVEETTPVVEETAPVVEEPAPVVEEPAPVVEEPTPVVEETAPVVEEPAPVVEGPVPVPPMPPISKKEAKRMAKEAKKAAAMVAPVVSDGQNMNNIPVVEKYAEKHGSKTSVLGVLGGVLFSFFLIVAIVFSYISSVAVGICSLGAENFEINVDGTAYSVGDFTDTAKQLGDEETDTGKLVKAIVEYDGTCQIKVGTKIYDVDFDTETIQMFKDVVLSDGGITTAVDSALGIGFVVFVVILVFSIFAAMSAVVAIRGCFGKKKAGNIVPAVILLVFGLLVTVVSVLGMAAPELISVLSVFAAQPVMISSLIPAVLAVLSGVILLILGLLSGKKKA